MTNPDSQADPGATQREAISCPGCGRHDWVQWPKDQGTYPWKCFNCGKSFDLTRQRAH